VAVHFPVGTTIRALAAGSDFGLALTSSGTGLAWGGNEYGQLGDGTTLVRDLPVPVHLPVGVTIKAIAAGEGSTQAGFISGAFSLAVTSSGTGLAWGDNGYGQLGDGTSVVRHLPVPVQLPAGTTITAIAAGADFSLALTSSGTMLAWGGNEYGELGDGTTLVRHLPVPVKLPANTTIKAIAAGSDFSLALTSSGTMLAWGDNGYGQLGDGTSVVRHLPVRVKLPAGTTIKAIAAGSDFSLALTSSGTVLAWGGNEYGQLGDGTTLVRHLPVHVRLPAGTTIKAITAGAAIGDSSFISGAFSLAVTSSGAGLAWGLNNYGQLGNGTTAISDIPVHVHLPTGITSSAIVAGGDFSLSLTG
jgi:alpha-tubulin suppressor-like RCC1 family protein